MTQSAGMTRRLTHRGVSLLASCLLLASLAVPALADSPAQTPSLAFTVSAGDHPFIVRARGLVAAEVEMDLIVPSGLGSPIIETLAEQGTVVKKDDVVVGLSIFDVEKEVRKAQIELARKKAELSRREREDGIKIAEYEDKLRQKQHNLDASRAALALLEAGPDPLEAKRLELKVRAIEIELGDLERKDGTQQALARKGFASSLEADEARGALLRKRLELQKERNLLARERMGARSEDIEKQRLSAASLERQVELARRDLKEQAGILALEREKIALEIQAKEAKVAEKNHAKSQSLLKAPIDGTVIHRQNFFGREPYQVGSQVWEGASIAQVVRMERPRATVKVSERAIDRVKEDMTAILMLPAEPGRKYTGKVLQVSGVPKPRERGDPAGAKDFEVTLVFEGKASHLKPNLPVIADIETGRLTAVFRVPKETVDEHEKTRDLKVRKLTASGVEVVAVKAADEDHNWFYLQSGVAAGDRLLYEW